MIKPTVGRVVWFYPSVAWAAENDVAYGVPGEPLTALIAHVINERMINLAAFDQNGKPFNATSVPLLEENVPLNDDSMSFHAVWMPYQKGQAAKAEALEKSMINGVDKFLETRIPILDQITDLCQAIEKCGASPELTDAVVKAGALREPISELVRQAIDLGIGTGLVGVSYSNQVGDMPTPTTAPCGHGFNDRSFVTRDLVMNLICQGKPTEHIQHDVPLLLELIYGVDPAKAECDRGPDIELVHTSLSDAKRSAPPVDLIELSSTSLTFGDAIQALKAGHKVARSGWNGKGMFLSLSCDGTREVAAENFWSPHNAQFARENGGTATVLPSITMKTATGEILMGWLASQTDMLAEDWVVLDQPVGYEAITTEGT